MVSLLTNNNVTIEQWNNIVYLKNNGANDIKINNIEEIIITTFHKLSRFIFFPKTLIVKIIANCYNKNYAYQPSPTI